MLIEMVSNIILFFFLYSFLGWLLELFFKLFVHKKLINSGVLHGPILPIYGFSVLSILLVFYLSPLSVFINLFIAAILVTLLEYGAALFCEKIIGIKFWDYSNMKFDYKGRISLEFIGIWAILIALFIFIIEPAFNPYIVTIPYVYKLSLSLLFLILFLLDFTITVVTLARVRKFIKLLHKNYKFKSVDAYLNNFSHLLKAFPDIYKYIKRKAKKALNKKND